MSLAWLEGTGALWIGLGAALAALALRILTLRRARAERRRLVDDPLLARMVRMPPPAQEPIRAALFAVGVGLLAAAAAGAGSGRVDGRPRGAPETVLALDASNSMLAEDVSPSRLAVQRALASELASSLTGPVGVVYFAGAGYALSPLTQDRGATLMYVDAVRPASVARGGSSLAAGLSQALTVVAGGDPSALRQVVIFSDGEETVDRPLDEALALAARAGVRVHAVGIGTAEGGRIPLGPNAGVPGDAGEGEADDGGPGAGEAQAADSGPAYLTDAAGEVVVTRLGDAALRRIAEATGGEYVPGTPEGIGSLRSVLVGANAPASGGGARGTALLLLVAAFALLWADAFLFRSA